MSERPRRGTATSNFGVGRRESHDASGFYGRFSAPNLSADDEVAPPKPVEDPFICGDARAMTAVEDHSVALVVTSPPYFAGKQYEEELERDGVPASYLEYLEMLTAVFAECMRVLEPGGRIAVNVANLGRKPYRSLSADVIGILQDRLGLLLRGEIVWAKAEGASGSCAWGSYRNATNPVLRDVTERVVVASKGRFDRARSVKQRQREGLPSQSTVGADDFMALTLDVWSIPPESARRVGHPAPFPVELPEQLIRLYTFADDLVLDPFMGSGSSLVAAAALGRRYVGYDLDPAYVTIARDRVASRLADDTGTDRVRDDEPTLRSRAAVALADAGFTIVATDRKVASTGVVVAFDALDGAGRRVLIEVAGSGVSHRGGLTRTDTVWRTLGRLAALRGALGEEVPIIVLTTDPPKRRSDGDLALRSAGPRSCLDIIDLDDRAAVERLRQYGEGHGPGPLPGFWSADDFL